MLIKLYNRHASIKNPMGADYLRLIQSFVDKIGTPDWMYNREEKTP